MAVHDYKCSTCAAYAENCVEAPEGCECGGEMSKTYELWTTIGTAGPEFTPLRLPDGREFTTKSDWQRAKAAIELNTGGTGELESMTAARKKRRHEERKHKTWKIRRDAGFCDKDVSDRKTELKRKKQESENAPHT